MLVLKDGLNTIVVRSDTLNCCIEHEYWVGRLRSTHSSITNPSVNDSVIFRVFVDKTILSAKWRFSFTVGSPYDFNLGVIEPAQWWSYLELYNVPELDSPLEGCPCFIDIAIYDIPTNTSHDNFPPC